MYASALKSALGHGVFEGIAKDIGPAKLRRFPRIISLLRFAPRSEACDVGVGPQASWLELAVVAFEVDYVAVGRTPVVAELGTDVIDAVEYPVVCGILALAVACS